MKKVLVLTDNEQQLWGFRTLIAAKEIDASIQYAYSEGNVVFGEKFKSSPWIIPLRIRDHMKELKEYDLIISLHCKQVFPAALVMAVRCVNIHPGYNPYNRGWFPHIFSIINGLPCGATIHEMDTQLDHGPVIYKEVVEIKLWDTSHSLYKRVLEAELKLLDKHLEEIIEGNYQTSPCKEGNINRREDFLTLCKIDLDDRDTFRNHINRLKALTHGRQCNAYIVDPETGHKIYLKLELELES